jgi:hypothetical protein
MATIIRDNKLTKIAEGVKLDNKRRVLLPKNSARAGTIYHIYTNNYGQIILDPQVTIPASEAWLFNNPDAFALVQRGLADAAEGRVSRVDLDSL